MGMGMGTTRQFNKQNWLQINKMKSVPNGEKIGQKLYTDHRHHKFIHLMFIEQKGNH